jgi:hypothetical protein
MQPKKKTTISFQSVCGAIVSLSTISEFASTVSRADALLKAIRSLALVLVGHSALYCACNATWYLCALDFGYVSGFRQIDNYFVDFCCNVKVH